MRKALLVVSFGTSHAETRKRTIEAIERDLHCAFPERRFYRAWTSGIIRKKIMEEEGVAIDSVPDAMERMLHDGIGDVLVQPTHMMAGREYGKTENELFCWRSRFSHLCMGTPLLQERDDVRRLARVLESVFSGILPTDLLALMGHGSADLEENPYELLTQCFAADGYEQFCVGTVEHAPGLAPVMSMARERNPGTIYLAPLMVVAGDHALKDMAGTSKDSWQWQLRRCGFETVSILKGIGEYEQVREIYVAHARRAETMQNG